MARQHKIIAVVIKQYGTGLYRSCVSMGRENTIYLGTYRDERSASEKIDQFWKAYDEGQIREAEDLVRLGHEQSVPATSDVSVTLLAA